MERRNKQIGKTKDVGWQFGLRKTLPLSQESVWDFMFSEQGLKIWLGELEQDLEVKKHYKTKSGIDGLIRVLKPYSHIRMNWKKQNWDNLSTLQVRVMGDNRKATISFHQEKLLDNKQREEMKTYWNEKMTKIEKALIDGKTTTR
ncbi:SRPBCC domain-containing protein [Algoriphagus sp.]|uniref:SRPBCC domain-containing protein n=1 Tax=Algoriphagus sp. TaxID=1872435 RepID=UPI003F6F29E3